MDVTWLLVVLILVVVFASISVVGALHRVRDAVERSERLMERVLAERMPPADPSIPEMPGRSAPERR
jgi:uncharacterized membrane protein